MFTEILVPLDGSILAEKALPPALELARQFGGRITLLRVVHVPVLPSVAGMTSTELHSRLRKRAYSEACDYLKACAGSLRQQGHDVRYQIEIGNPVAEPILAAVDRFNIDTIVMSTHGWGGVQRWVYGSVADKILRHARVPVLLVRIDTVTSTTPATAAESLATSLN